MSLFDICVVFVRGGGVQTQAAPGLGDDDAVGGVLRVVTDLDGQVDADATDVVRQRGDDLPALVTDAGDSVVVDDDLRDARRFFLARQYVLGGQGVLIGRHVGDAAIGDAADIGEEISTIALDLFGGKPGALEKVPGNARRRRRPYCNGSDVSWGTKREKQLGWNRRQHGSLSKSIVQRGGVEGTRCCESKGLLGDGEARGVEYLRIFMFPVAVGSASFR